MPVGFNIEANMEKDQEIEVDALCPKFGNAFKAHMDRVLHSHGSANDPHNTECLVCSCSGCDIGP